jgi:maleate cis-trans isomerase
MARNLMQNAQKRAIVRVVKTVGFDTDTACVEAFEALEAKVALLTKLKQTPLEQRAEFIKANGIDLTRHLEAVVEDAINLYYLYRQTFVSDSDHD